MHGLRHREPRAIGINETVKGVGCNPARREQRLAASHVQANKRQGASCPENCINRAAAAQAALLAEIHAAIIKAKDHELKALLTAMLGHATHGQLPLDWFKKARELAVIQALADGKAQENTAETKHLGEDPQLM
jgi:hypothetical protein